MPSAPKLTLTQHQALGEQLRDVMETLQRLGIDLSRRYGKNAKLTRRALRAERALLELRSELDSQLARDHPQDFAPEVYF